eukprot:TRINITY_DN16906_c0_g1_i1.p2 TRINITY_DN16906_c0_g1~~TRINITY_DN16906_c0_g1_i1.p2  ORF type:complete len:142 (-),score=28.25 TRINITY_DN16906_c0_g1_i1:31-456(-)
MFRIRFKMLRTLSMRPVVSAHLRPTSQLWRNRGVVDSQHINNLLRRCLSSSTQLEQRDSFKSKQGEQRKSESVKDEDEEERWQDALSSPQQMKTYTQAFLGVCFMGFAYVIFGVVKKQPVFDMTETEDNKNKGGKPEDGTQ